MGDGPFESDIGSVNSHPLKGTHWVANMNEIYFDSYGSGPPNKLSRFVRKRTEHYLYCECKLQSLTKKRNSYCASYCFHINYFTKVIGIDFKSSVLEL